MITEKIVLKRYMDDGYNNIHQVAEGEFTIEELNNIFIRSIPKNIVFKPFNSFSEFADYTKDVDHYDERPEVYFQAETLREIGGGWLEHSNVTLDSDNAGNSLDEVVGYINGIEVCRF